MPPRNKKSSSRYRQRRKKREEKIDGAKGEHISEEPYISDISDISMSYPSIGLLHRWILNDMINIMEYQDDQALRFDADRYLSSELKSIKVDTSNVSVSNIILGEGAFGLVRKGTLLKSGTSIDVAIKEPSQGHAKILFNEAEIMLQMDHDNLIKILGIRTTPTLAIIVEFMDLGDIKQCILERKAEFSVKQLILGIVDISSGMEYLAKKKIVHMDLAPRNIFVDSKKKFKIGDFSVAREITENKDYYQLEYTKSELEGWYYLAPEVKDTLRFSEKSDVWAMGILIWELFQLSALDGTSTVYHIKMVKILGSKYRLPCPKGCPRVIYCFAVEEMMHKNPSKRPNFMNVKKKILSIQL